jgi:hypothetical protein
MGGNGDGVYKHPAIENWASEASRLGALNRDGPHRACTFNIPCHLSRLNTMLAMYKKNECFQFINVCVNNDARKILFFFPLQVKNKTT